MRDHAKYSEWMLWQKIVIEQLIEGHKLTYTVV